MLVKGCCHEHGDFAGVGQGCFDRYTNPVFLRSLMMPNAKNVGNASASASSYAEEAMLSVAVILLSCVAPAAAAAADVQR